jgi:hypothetical protein
MGDIAVQRITKDVPRIGATLTAPTDFTSFASLGSTVVRNNCSRFCHCGYYTLGSSTTLDADELSLLVELTDTDEITLSRLVAGTDGDGRCDLESWTYTGSSGGVNEFKIISRHEIAMAIGTDSTTATLDNTPSNINDCVCFIVGQESDSNRDDLQDLMHVAWVSGTNTLNVERSSSDGASKVNIVVVEFTGSAWSVGHFVQSSPVSNTWVDTTLNTHPDGVSGSTFDATNWSKAMVLGAFKTGGNTYDSLQQTSFVLRPKSGDTNTVQLYTQSNSGTARGSVIYHSDLSVTLFEGSSFSWALSQSVDITSAGLTDLSESGAILTTYSSGSGNLFPRGIVNVNLDSLTSVGLYTGKTGNSAVYALQVVDFSGISSGSPSYNVPEIVHHLKQQGIM